MDELELVLQEIAENLDRRRSEFTKLRRMILNYAEKPLEVTAVRMGIPMIYAEWEGYVREVCQLYLEHVESAVNRCKELKPALLGYLWTPVLRPLTGGLNSERKKIVAETILSCLDGSVSFSDTEKAIETKSNLNYEALEMIASSLCLDIDCLIGWKSHLNALVHLRNNIAHGSRPTSLTFSDFDNNASTTLQLMENFEKVLVSALITKSFFANAA
jgi:RiboL-PSP-HEPN